MMYVDIMSRKTPGDPSENHVRGPAEEAPHGPRGDVPDQVPDELDSDARAKYHDALFKSVFSDVEHAAAVLRSILPPHVAAHIDWDSLQPVHASLVRDSLQQQHGDLLFQARLIDGREAFLWLLFEHQTTVDFWMVWRTTEMAFDFLRDWRKKHPSAPRLPAFLPIVLYQGSRPWTAPTSLLELTNLSDDARRDLAGHLLSFRFVLDELRTVEDEALAMRPLGPVPRLTLGIMKYYQSRQLIVFLAEHADDIRTLYATEHGRLWLSRMLSYIAYAHPHVARGELIRLLTPLVGEEIQHTMLPIDELLSQGIYDQGRKAGLEQGLQSQRALLIRQLTRRFGTLPEEVAARVTRADTEDIARWGDRIFDAASLDDVFAS